MADDLSIAVYGTGAVGGYLGAKLASAAGSHVTLIGRERVVEAIRSHGLVLRENGAAVATSVPATTSIDGLSPFDLVLLTVRTYDVANAIPDVKALLGDSGLLLAVQNGVGSEETLADALGRDRVLTGTLTVSAGMEEPGIVTRYSRQGGVALATMNGAPVPASVTKIIQNTGLPTVTVDDYRSLRWSKLLLNMIGAATTAILDIDMSALVTNLSLFRMEQLAFREAGKVMDAQRIRSVELPGYPVPLARTVMRLPKWLAQWTLGRKIAGARAGHSPTMRADMMRGKSEVAFLNGAVARAGTKLGVSTPVNAALTELTEELVRDPPARERYRRNPEALLTFLAEYADRLEHLQR